MHLECPECGERERLQGSRAGDVIEIECLACGSSWSRDPTPRCRLCGSTNLRYRPEPLWEKGRGDQRTPAGRIDGYACNDCRGFDVTSSSPRPAD